MGDIGLCVILCGGFIGSFYAWPKERRFAWLCLKDLKKASEDGPHRVNRNDHATIRRRLVSFVGNIAVSLLFLEYLLRLEPENENLAWGSAVVHRLIFSEDTFAQSAATVLAAGVATLVLFSGPLMEEGLSCFRFDDPVLELRDIVVCPLGEEVFFRALLLQILKEHSTTSSIIISSVLFSLSHTHHIFSFAVGERLEAVECGEPDADAIIYWKRAAGKLAGVCACSLAYGLLGGYFYTTVCRRNLLAVVLSHSICNIMGAPPFGFVREGQGRTRLAYAAVYVAGVVGWALIVAGIRRR
ncbi:CAAX prenyl protease 2 [Trypanosoma grayi]|uniref:CAAX prenyl protease 2 n=1 Tax=Trypanosoma grayi TaxID=71804 RepID=UPI0004F4A9FA|nr:CAAX prenyl protease 2 [Trypanosoma grayi]KEG10425.1 CAAX prenyl protease 2 [Trypanosoma grayi]